MNDRNISLAGHGSTSCEIAHIGTVSDSTQNIRQLAAKFSRARTATHKVYFSLVKTAQIGSVNTAFKSAPPYKPVEKKAAGTFSRWEWFMDFMGSIGGQNLGKIPLLAVADIAQATAKRIDDESDLLDSLIAVCEEEEAKRVKADEARTHFTTAKSQLDELKESVSHLREVAGAVVEQCYEHETSLNNA